LPSAPRCFGSITTKLDKPVISSACRCTVMPSSNSAKRTNPATSVMIGWVYGSQRAIYLAGLDRAAILDRQFRAVGDLVAFALTALLVHQGDFSRARHGNQMAVPALHDFHLVQAQETLGFTLHAVW
jgi:hypothetical protein